MSETDFSNPFASPWTTYELVSVDTETTGKYPLESELCEVAAVKWKDGQITGRYQSLIRPTAPMGQDVIRIHGITNEMVADAPPASAVLPQLHEFIGHGVVVAHHAPFDMGFLTVEFEKLSLPLPSMPALCSSLISRQTLFDTPNHRLQTLIQHLGLPQGQAHRALDDAEACLQVLLHCLEKLGRDLRLEEIYARQGGRLDWQKYSIRDLRANPAYTSLIDALSRRQDVQITYQGGSLKNQPRTVKPLGLVRNPQGDYLIASDGPGQPKKFFLNKITNSNL